MSKGLIAALITVFVVAVVGVAWFAISEKAEQDAKTAEIALETNADVVNENSGVAADDASDTAIEEEGELVEAPATITEEPVAVDTSTADPASTTPAQQEGENQVKNREPIGAETEARTCPHCGSVGRVGDPYCQYCGSQF